MIINNTLLHVNVFESKENNDITLIITHGLADKSDSFDYVANKFMELGYNVITYDIRGHGRSLGKRGYIKDYNLFIEDLNYLVNKAYTKTKKVYVIGHSMGGLITNLYMTKYNDADGAVIVASPTYKLKQLNMFRFIPKFLINRIKLKTNYNDPYLNKENNYVKSPYDIDYFYFKLINEMMIKGMKYFNKNLNKYNGDVLLIYSKEDKLVSLDNQTHMYNNIISENKKKIIYEKSYHNIFTDIEKDKLIKDIDEWVRNSGKEIYNNN